MRWHVGFCAGLFCLLSGGAAWAEPWISVRSGQPCHACHVNGSGGGQRTVFGSAYAAGELSRRPLLENQFDPELAIAEGLRLGGNARFSARQFEPDEGDGNLEFATDRASLYADFRLTSTLDLYLDQQVAPGGSLNREAWARFAWGQWYLKAGKFFLPYGWRLEDDTAYVRQATGINFATPDNGVELAYQSHALQAQLSLTNGSGGGSETNDGKMVAFRANWLGALGQLGVNAAYNDGDGAERTLLGVTAGLNTGPLAWLLAYDHIDDQLDVGPDEQLDVALVELNWWIVRGHNLKLSTEWQSADGGGDRDRVSLVWEYFPFSYTQLRVGFRSQRSDRLPFAEGEEYFVQAHIYF